jgi:hypothetical protein
MKKVLKVCLIFSLVFAACKENKKTEKNDITTEVVINYDSFGDKISDEGVINAKTMLGTFKSLKAGDTLSVKFAATINEVCSKKGCWMKLDLTDGTETMVRFKDYGFFMPLDANNKEVIVSGKAFVKETSVKELQHYAEDAEKTKEEIALITESKVEFSFEADGVLMKKAK